MLPPLPLKSNGHPIIAPWRYASAIVEGQGENLGKQ